MKQINNDVVSQPLNEFIAEVDALINQTRMMINALNKIYDYIDLKKEALRECCKITKLENNRLCYGAKVELLEEIEDYINELIEVEQ